MAVVVIAAAAGGLWYYNNNKDKGETVSIAYLNLGYYPFMVGFHDGWFDDLPFNVEPVVVNGSGQDAVMIENCGMEDEKIYRSAEEIPESSGYYSLIIVKENQQK